MTAVTVYTTPSCPGCNATKKRLIKLGVEFTEHAIDEFVTEAAKFLGMSTAPIVCVSTETGDWWWDAYRPDRIDALAVIEQNEKS